MREEEVGRRRRERNSWGDAGEMEETGRRSEAVLKES